MNIREMLESLLDRQQHSRLTAGEKRVIAKQIIRLFEGEDG